MDTIQVGLISVALAASLARGVWVFCQVPPLAPVVGGRRARNRRRAFGQSQSLECALRYLAALLQCGIDGVLHFLPALAPFFRRLEREQTKRLVWAGQPAGLSAVESFVLALLAATALGGAAAWWSEGSWMWVLPSGIVGLFLVNLRLSGVIEERFLRMSHELPSVIDLTALAMNAGSDFPGALRKVVEGQRGVAGDELRQVLFSLELGITRGAALLALEERCPIPEVRDLVRAIVMADKKGASVAVALQQQARTSRERRSVRAEEAAARAGVLLILPMMLLMGCVLILLVGPLFCQGAGL